MRRFVCIAALLAALHAPTSVAQGNPRESGLVIQPVRGIYGHLLEGHFLEPSGVAYDPYQKELFICDAGSHRIAITNDRGFPTFSFGSSTTLISPRQVAIDRSGRMVVADSGYPGLRMFDYDGEVLPDLDISGIPEAEHPLRVLSLTIGPRGDLFVLDGANRRVIVMNLRGHVKTVFGPPPGRSDLMRAPVDLAVAPNGNVAIVDATGLSVQIFDSAGTFIRGWGDHDIGLSSFSLPAAITIDEENRVFVADTLRHDIKVFSPEGDFLTNFGGWGNRPGQVRYPVALANDRGGRVFVVERAGRRVQIFSVK